MNDCFVIFRSKIFYISQSDLHDFKEHERIVEQMIADVKKIDDSADDIEHQTRRYNLWIERSGR